jgi:hypothetical protein
MVHIEKFLNFTPYLNLLKVKVKQSRNRPGVAQRVPGGLGSQTIGTLR